MSNEKRNPIRVHIGPPKDYCMACGEAVPEGWEVCPRCWDECFNMSDVK